MCINSFYFYILFLVFIALYFLFFALICMRSYKAYVGYAHSFVIIRVYMYIFNKDENTNKKKYKQTE